MEAFGQRFREVATTLAWGGVWCRTGLSLRDRSLITVAVLAALNRVDELAMHLPPAIRNGLQLDELEEALIHVGIYAGFPAAATAISVGQRALSSGAHVPNEE
jgi:4-carboxymuconolactone decarboxylase